ncbi:MULTISPECIES: MobF family relaxase [unclassified Nocardioides]|uniref:MobF family relaxase n=1 Tax=unclassified Nocardioides TaxID=2615069 RepID=UPI000A481C22|nr:MULTISPECIES: MobF family relaxase [unclassified Nocardioides]
MTLKKLAAGSGYEYLTRQVAAADTTELGRTKLADYYSVKGEAPGLWIGSGLVGITGIEGGDPVTAAQMQNLFGHGQDPVSGTALGRAYRPDAVAGFDLTFSAVKSVSTLWAVAPPEMAMTIRQAHDAAVADAVAFLEAHAVFTREGTDGVRQVETRGLIAAAFTHRDSRAGDPDLHTHVAVANKVQTREGKWLSLYGTVLHRYVVAASETYNTALEHHLVEQLGVRFVDTGRGLGKRPVREIADVDAMLCERWSHRRRDIDARVDALSADFAVAHCRPPTAKESIALEQRANLETRAPKHEARAEAHQRTTWRAEAVQELGQLGLNRMVDSALHPDAIDQPQVSATWLDAAAVRVISELEDRRATWQSWHLYAEAQRQVRGIDVPAHQVDAVVEHLVETATRMLINLTPDRDPVTEPAALRRSDGTSVYRHTGADHFTSQRILDAEQRIVRAAGQPCGTSIDPIDIELSLMKAELDGARLNAGQRELVLAMLSDPRQVALALAPAGSGKTTAMSALARVCGDLGYTTIGLAPSAAASAVLREATGMPTETLARLDHLLASAADLDIGPRTVVVIDEAGMADTPTLDRIIAACCDRGARVRLIGDDQQLAAIGAGGVLRDVATTHGAVRLEEVVRFADPVEATASLDLRAGNRAAVAFYLDHDRIHTGDADTSISEVLTEWTAERAVGRECLMLAPTRELVARLNRGARTARSAGSPPTDEVDLVDGNRASVGDTILTRHNDRRLAVSGTDWVKNGDRWTVTTVGRDGSLSARHLGSRLTVTLPPEYVTRHVELGYATTVYTAQGSTADVMHGIVTGTEDRQLLYTMLTRGREENHLHLVIDQADDTAEQFLPGIDEQLSAVETLDRIVDRDGAATSATSVLVNSTSAAARLRDAARRYADAVETAANRLIGANANAALEAAGSGPLPWLPDIPCTVRGHPEWCSYLTARADHVAELADRVRATAALPDTLARFEGILTTELREAVTVWRAASGVPAGERSLLGPAVDEPTAARFARGLLREVHDLYPPAVRTWEQRVSDQLGRSDEHTLEVAQRLDAAQRSGLNAAMILRRALAKPLPNDKPTEALDYRVQRTVTQWRGVAAPGTRPEPTHPAAGLEL